MLVHRVQRELKLSLHRLISFINNKVWDYFIRCSAYILLKAISTFFLKEKGWNCLILICTLCNLGWVTLIKIYSFFYLYKCRILSIPSERKTPNENHNFPERRASASSSSCKNEILQGNCCISNMPLWMDGYLTLCVDSTRTLFWCLFRERNWVFATKSDFLIPISLKPNVVDHRYFKLWILVNQAM